MNRFTVFNRTWPMMTFTLGLMCWLCTAPAMAQDVAMTSSNAPVVGSAAAVSMWSPSMPIVEQLQSIHRLGQENNMTALWMLSQALQSQFSLARRKASKLLVEKANNPSPEARQILMLTAQQNQNTPDPVVQRYLTQLNQQLH